MTTKVFSYSGDENWLMSWEYAHPQLSVQVGALIATLFAFQLSALIFDILLGIKARNLSSASDLHMILLARSLSPLAILSNLFRLDFISRLYYGRDIPVSSEIARDSGRIKFAAAVKFLVIVSLFPLCNIAAIVLSLRKETTLSFRDVQFKNVALGVARDPGNLIFTAKNAKPLKLLSAMKPGDSSLAHFTMASQRHFFENGAEEKRARLAINVDYSHTLGILAEVNGIRLSSSKTLITYTGKQLYAILATYSVEDFQFVLGSAMALMARECGHLRHHHDGARTFENGVENEIECSNVTSPKNTITKTVLLIEKHVGIISAEETLLKIFDNDDIANESPTKSMKDMVYLKRIRKNISLYGLLAAYGVVLLLRLICSVFLNNDTDVGLERIVKDRMGYRCCETVLGGMTGFLEYRLKHQKGVACNYGLARFDMSPVHAFDGGIIGWKPEDLCKEPQ